MTNWRGNIQIKDLLSEDDVADDEAIALAETAAGRIEQCDLFPSNVREEVATGFRETVDMETFNDAMNALYDAADSLLVWVA